MQGAGLSSPVHRSVSCSFSCAQVNQLHTSQSAAHRSVSCVHVGQLSTGRSAVHRSVSCAQVGQVCTGQSAVHWSVSCALVSHVCTGLGYIYVAAEYSNSEEKVRNSIKKIDFDFLNQ